MSHFPGEGTVRCLGHPVTGEACGNMEVEGLERCPHHVPDEYLDEAEQITGIIRCRRDFGEPDACRYFAVKGTDPPRCKVHGANLGSVMSKRAALAVVESKAQDSAAELVAEHMDLLLSPPPIGDPLAKLLQLADEMDAFREIARKRLSYLKTSNWRYEKSRMGEQVRAEITIYERAMEREASLLLSIARLHIDQAMNRIEDAQVVVVVRAVTVALQSVKLPLEDRQRVLDVLRRELTAA